MKLNLELIQYINLFEKITRVNVKNCFFHKDNLVFIVSNGQISRAIGKKGFNIKKISRMINKKIKIAEYNDDPVKFINSYVSPIDVDHIELKDKTINIKAKNSKDKGLLIGRNGRNLENIKNLINYYFKIEKVRII